MTAYYDLLKDPRWQKRRLEILEKHGFRCQECMDDSTELHVHHRRYVKGRKPWEYEDSELLTLCKHCHAEVTDLASKVGIAAGMLGQYRMTELLGYARAILLEGGGRMLIANYNEAKGVADRFGVEHETLLAFLRDHERWATADDIRSLKRASEATE